MVVGLFAYRRKQMLRGLRELTGWPAGRAGAALGRAGIEQEVRVEAVTASALARLHAALVDDGWEPD
jgi:hypothetical protein